MVIGANRIVDLIKTAPGKLDIPYIQKMQGDMYDANAATLVPLLLKLNGSFSEQSPNALTCSRNWDFQAEIRFGCRGGVYLSGVISCRTHSMTICPKNY